MKKDVSEAPSGEPSRLVVTSDGLYTGAAVQFHTNVIVANWSQVLEGLMSLLHCVYGQKSFLCEGLLGQTGIRRDVDVMMLWWRQPVTWCQDPRPSVGWR